MNARLVLCMIIPLILGSADLYTTSPEQVVRNYLRALKNSDFVDAHQYLSDEMTRGLDVFNWAVEQKQIFKRAGVEINAYKIYDAKVEPGKAHVPNILSSRDNIFNKNGSDEYELYVLISDNGQWYIDRQKLIDKKNRDTWFKKLKYSSE